MIMDVTLLAMYTDTPEEQADGEYNRKKAQALNLKQESGEKLNTGWYEQRLGHRCKILPNGKPCCTNRSINKTQS